MVVRREERRALIIDAVNKVASSRHEGGFAILTDADQAENYVQFMKTAPGQATVEVTSRAWGGVLPPLTEEHIAALMRLGFSRPDTNLRQTMRLADPTAIAAISEQAFEILGSPATFTLGIEFQDLAPGETGRRI
jgi:hypothetical protein